LYYNEKVDEIGFLRLRRSSLEELIVERRIKLEIIIKVGAFSGMQTVIEKVGLSIFEQQVSQFGSLVFTKKENRTCENILI
jgi:hypothetical protein